VPTPLTNYFPTSQRMRTGTIGGELRCCCILGREDIAKRGNQ
jgi:hypothetical protein